MELSQSNLVLWFIIDFFPLVGYLPDLCPYVLGFVLCQILLLNTSNYTTIKERNTQD